MRILTVQDLTVAFGSHTAVEDVSFTLDAGSCLTIIGPNGSGKSVLIKALMGTLPYTGTVTWDPSARFGYVPQKIEADRRLPLNFGNILRAKCEQLGLSLIQIEDTIHSIGMSRSLLSVPIGYLSGGQFQKALVAFALLGRPNVLILDEPTASIDVAGEEQIYDLIHRIQEQYHLTVILVSHEMSIVFRYATEVLCLNRRLVCYGPPQTTLTPQHLTELYERPHKIYDHHHSA